MSEKHQKIQDLFRNYCQEQPSNDYYERFLDEFHERQRVELLQTSSRGLLFERVQTWFSDFARPAWVYGAGLGAAYAAVMAAVLFWPSEEKEGMIKGQNVIPASADVHFSDLPVIEVDFAKKREESPSPSQAMEF